MTFTRLNWDEQNWTVLTKKKFQHISGKVDLFRTFLWQTSKQPFALIKIRSRFPFWNAQTGWLGFFFGSLSHLSKILQQKSTPKVLLEPLFSLQDWYHHCHKKICSHLSTSKHKILKLSSYCQLILFNCFYFWGLQPICGHLVNVCHLDVYHVKPSNHQSSAKSLEWFWLVELSFPKFAIINLSSKANESSSWKYLYFDTPTWI